MYDVRRTTECIWCGWYIIHMYNVYPKWQRAEKRGLTLTHTHFGVKIHAYMSYFVPSALFRFKIKNTVCIELRWSREIAQLRRVVSVSLAYIAAAKGSTYPKVHFMFKFAVTAIQIYTNYPYWLNSRQMCALGLHVPFARLSSLTISMCDIMLNLNE